MKMKHIPIVCTLILVAFSCNDGEDFRDPYVGDYYGSGYSGDIVVEETGEVKDVDGGGTVITVGKDKSSVHILTIKINDQTFSAHIENGGLSIDALEYDWTDNTPGYTYQVYQSGTGTITPTTIDLHFQYSGMAKYEPDPGDPSQTKYYTIGGQGSCSGSR